MMLPLQNYTAAHRYLLDLAAKAAGMSDPVAFTPGNHSLLLLKSARKREAVPVDGVSVRDWNPDNRKIYSGLQLGIRLYEIETISFAAIQCNLDFNANEAITSFFAVSRRHYTRLYRIAHRLLHANESAGEAPILSQEQSDKLWENTIGFLGSDRLARIKEHGGRPRRGVLLSGPPGNGKTMACRWIWDECCRRNWEYRIVAPDTYRKARQRCNAEEAVRQLFSVQRRGVIFFDDMDLALRDRNRADETEDQAIFLTALDGIRPQEGVAYVFTTNCPLESIDRAFKRPGRIDVALRFDPPDDALRRRLLLRWHADIRRHLDLDGAVTDTAGYSFAEIEELRNLLIMHHADAGRWSWAWAVGQFSENREDLRAQLRRALGFSLAQVPVHKQRYQEAEE